MLRDASNNGWSFLVFADIVRNTASTKLNQAKNKVSEISQLHDDWDGYGAVRVSEKVIINTFSFIDVLKENFDIVVNSDDITPTPYGTIDVDIRSTKGLVSVEVGKTQIGFFTDFADGNYYHSDGEDTDFYSIPESLNSVLLTL